MASPAFRSSQHANSGGTASLSVSKPANLAVNDILIAFVYYENNSAVTITPPSGFAQLTNCAGDNTSTNPDLHGRVYWKRATQTDVDATGFAFGFSPSSATNITLAAFSGARTGSDPVEDSDKTTGRGNATLPSVDAATADTLIIGAVMSFEWTSTWSSAAMTERADTDANALYTLVQASAGASGTKAITQTTNDYFTGAMLVLASVAAGTNYPQAVSGGITPSGAAVKEARKAAAGSVTPSGALIKAARKVVSGAITPAGAAVKSARKILSGGITPAGVVAGIKIALISLAGEIIPGGGLVRSARKAVGGGITPAGGVVNSTRKVLSGALQPAGGLARRAGKVLAGVIAGAGELAGQKIAGGGDLFFQAVDGALTSAGALVLQTGKTLGGALSPVGSVSKRVALAASRMTGALQPAGALALQTGKILAGTIAPSGGLVRRAGKALSGALGAAGELLTTVTKVLVVATGGRGFPGPSGTRNNLSTDLSPRPFPEGKGRREGNEPGKRRGEAGGRRR